jgi:hypothetical protein
LRSGEPSPDIALGLQPGELVRVKPFEQILATVNARSMHRGMSFDVEMVPYCGRVYRVHARVETFVDERTGHIKKLKTPAVILQGVTCGGRYSNNRWLCPRGIFPWWREVWLERVGEADVLRTDREVADRRKAAGPHLAEASVSAASGSSLRV